MPTFGKLLYECLPGGKSEPGQPYKPVWVIFRDFLVHGAILPDSLRRSIRIKFKNNENQFIFWKRIRWLQDGKMQNSVIRNRFRSILSTKLLIVCVLFYFTTATFIVAKDSRTNCVDITGAEALELLKLKIYKKNLFEIPSCSIGEEAQIAYNAKVKLRGKLFEENDYGLSEFLEVVQLTECDAMLATYHVWAYFLFHEQRTFFDDGLTAFDQHLSTMGAGCPEITSGFVSSKILHVLLNQEQYEPVEVDFAQSGEAIASWRNMIELGHTYAKINIEILSALQSGRLLDFPLSTSSMSTNIMNMSAMSAICRDEEPSTGMSELSIPSVKRLERKQILAPIEFKTFCESNELMIEMFDFVSEW